MSESKTNEPRYTEKEVGAILKRAAELQAGAPPRGGETSLSQLQQAASEIGIDPENLRRAAAEIESGSLHGPGATWLGGPWGVDYDRVLPGVVDDDSWPTIVEDMRAATGRVGSPKEVGKGYEWLSTEPDPLHITFTPTGTNTRLRVTARFGLWGGLLYTLPPFFSLMFAAMLSAVLSKHHTISPHMVLIILLGVPASVLLAGRALFGRITNKKRLQTQRLISRLETSLAATSQQVVEAAQTHSIPYVSAEQESAPTLQAGVRRD